MFISRSILVTALAVAALGWASSAFAQSAHVAGPEALQQAIDGQRVSDASDRAVVNRVLATSQAQAVAARFGLDLVQARSGVATLDDAAAAQLATTARAADAQLSGGRSNTVVISTTTLLLILIIVILLVR
jgi:nicotinate-nucleotide pyrophosphorylase